MKYVVDDKEFEVIINKKNNKNTYIKIENSKIIVNTNYLVDNIYIKKLLDNNYDIIKKMLERDFLKQQKNNSFYYLGNKYDIIVVNYCNIEINNNNIACFPYINGEYKSMRDNSEIIINKKYNATITTNGVESKLYVNGTLISSISVKDGVIGYPLNNTVVTLGANPKGTSAEAQFFNGTIYSARMYNRVLTKQEIKNNYEIDKSRFGM